MSDFIVYKKEICTCTNKNTVFDKCHKCNGHKTYLQPIDLEEAVIEVLVKSLKQNSRLSRLIRQTSVLPKLR